MVVAALAGAVAAAVTAAAPLGHSVKASNNVCTAPNARARHGNCDSGKRHRTIHPIVRSKTVSDLSAG
jgi:hypothetical protein